MDGLDEDAAQRLRALQILQSCWVAKNFMLLSMKQCGNSVIGPFAYWQSYVNPDIKQMGTMGSRHLGADCWSPAQLLLRIDVHSVQKDMLNKGIENTKEETKLFKDPKEAKPQET